MPYIGNPIYQSAFVTDQFNGDGSTVAFTMSVAPAGVSNVLVAVSGVLQDPSTYGVAGNTITFSTAPPSGTGNISCRYLGVPVTGIVTTAYRTVTEFTATASQTTFTPPSYTVGFINVYLNGVLLGSADYTATNGTTVVLATGASAGNLVTVESFRVETVLNAIPNTAGSVSSSNIQTSVALTTPTMTSPTISSGALTIGTISLGQGNASSFKNRIINGAMMIDQRNAGASINAGILTYTVDRFCTYFDTDGVMSYQQVADAPTGFKYSLKATTTTADSSLAAGQRSILLQRIEGYNVADFMLGTANAIQFTASFWVKSSLTGTFGGAFQNNGSDRAYPFTYTINSANTWEQKSITILGDTTGTWNTTNGTGLQIVWGLGVGSTYSGTAGSWQSGDYNSATGSVSVIGTLNATWQITGVQLEVGSTATSFDYRPYGTELQLCQRYYWKITKTNPYTGILNVAAFGGGDCYGVVPFPVPMRTNPTGSYGSALGDFRVAINGTTNSPTGITFQDPSTFNTVINFNGSFTAGNAGWVSFNDPTSTSTDFFAWSAEL